MRNIGLFPVEINTADYETLLRVPGIGVVSAKRIVTARRAGRLSFEDLKKLRVVLKRAAYFITCGGKYMFPSLKMSYDFIYNSLTADTSMLPQLQSGNQLSFFDSAQLLPSPREKLTSVTGQF